MKDLHSFKCQMCGNCCRIKNGIVRVSEDEIRRIAEYLDIPEFEFIERWTLVAPDRQSLILKSRDDGSCIYLNEHNRCDINAVKPEKCKTFPFEWTNDDSAQVCPALANQMQEPDNAVPFEGNSNINSSIDCIP